MDVTLFQQKIQQLISQLEEEVHHISNEHAREVEQLKEANKVGVDMLMNQFEERIKKVEEQHHSQILFFEEEISYLKELSPSQQIMMEENVGYIKKLEQKLNYFNKPS